MHETMQSPVLLDDRRTRPEHQMKGVAKDDVSAAGTHLFRGHRFDCAISAYRHEGRGFYRATGEGEPATTGRTVGLEELKMHEYHQPLEYFEISIQNP